jgi:fatty acid desaturase
MNLTFTPREELSDYEWDKQAKRWRRPDISVETLKELSKRSTWNGLGRFGLYLSLLIFSAWATLKVANVSIWLAIPVLYIYYFLYGFWVALAHELQHKTVFGKGADWFSEILFFFVQALVWNSPRYARISHKMHHRYTMVHDVDPETAWGINQDQELVRAVLFKQIRSILVIGAVGEWFRAVRCQIERLAGKRDELMQTFCSEEDVRAIRIESAGILVFHALVLTAAIAFRRWEPIVFVTIAWQIGGPFELLWHNTQHIGRLKNVNEQRLATRSIKVNPLVKLLYWGLDDHVEHHLYPAVPSYNLPKLHKLLSPMEAKPQGLFDCWREMFAIGTEKDVRPQNEYVPVTQEQLAK